MAEFISTRFSSNDQSAIFNPPKGFPYNIMTKTLMSFGYNDYTKENIPSAPMYRQIGNPIGSNDIEILINSAQVDVARISQWMFATGRGAKWVGEQAGLQMSNPNVESILPLSQNRVYIPAKSLASIGTAGTGIRFQRSGLFELEYSYENEIKNNQFLLDDQYKTGNRLIQLGKEINITNTTIIKEQSEKNAKTTINKRGKLFGYHPGRIFTTLSGIGGPSSIFGVGYTSIRSVKKSYGPFNDNDFKNQVSLPEYTYIDISSERNDIGANLDFNTNRLIKIYKEGNKNQVKEKDPITFPVNTESNAILKLNETDLKKQLDKIEGNTQSNEPNKKVTNYIIKTYNQLNKISGTVIASSNRMNSYKSVNGTYLYTLFQGNENKNGNKDRSYYEKYIKYTDPLNADQEITAEDYKGIKIKRLDEPDNVLYFKAFIENIGDSFTPKWNDIAYIGRPDTFRIYTGITRSISLTFLLVDFDGMEKIWNKTNQIAQFCSPRFFDDKMISPVLELTVLDLFKEVGYIDSLMIGIEKDYPWDLNPKQIPESDKYEPSVKPMIASITMTFQSMMDKLPSSTAQYYKTTN